MLNFSALTFISLNILIHIYFNLPDNSIIWSPYESDSVVYFVFVVLATLS